VRFGRALTIAALVTAVVLIGIGAVRIWQGW
jgi:hypothetical protein